MTYAFKHADIRTPTTQTVRARLDEGRGAFVVGGWGSGKTHAVWQTVRGTNALWVTAPARPSIVPRLITGIAAQMGDDAGVSAVEAYASEGCAAACAQLERLLTDDRVLVIDHAERLWSKTEPNPFEPHTADLWSDECSTFRVWLSRRCERTRTLAIASRVKPEVDSDAKVVHAAPTRWTVKLESSDQGYLPWTDVARRIHCNPSAMRNAAAALQFSGLGRMMRWLEETEEDSPRDAARALRRIVRDHAPLPLLKALLLLRVTDGLSGSLVQRLSEEDDDIALGLDLAVASRLVDDRGELWHPPSGGPFCEQHPSARALGIEPALRRLANDLLSRVNDRSSLSPRSARAVLDAHNLQLLARDFDAALTTARLHVGGLIVYARALSVEASEPQGYDLARSAYGSVMSLLETHTALGDNHTRAYVRHYRGYNGHRAHTMGLDRVAEDYDAAVGHWSDNALFHARRIALAAERGDAPRARRHLDSALEDVEEHPHKTSFLYVRPALWAFEAGATSFAMQHLDQYQPPAELKYVDPVGYAGLRRLHRAWREHGVDLREIDLPDGRQLVLTRAVRVKVWNEGGGWRAEAAYPPARAEGAGPWAAVVSLGQYIADECLRLVSRPTARLAPHDVSRKGLYIGAIDLGLSDIGLPLQNTRWLIGTLDEAQRFVPNHTDLAPLEVPADVVTPNTTPGMFFARVPVGRAGMPTGPINRLVPAGAGRTVEQLLHDLRRIVATEDDEAA